MKSTEKLIYTNENNESIEISWFSSIIPTEFSDSLDISINTAKNALQDGESYVSNSLNTRQIYINAFYQLNRASDALESRIKKVFNPKIGGRLRYISNDEKFIDVRLTSKPEIKSTSGKVDISIDMVGLDPFWRTSEKTEFLALLVPTLVYPLRFGKQVTFGRKVAQMESIIQNVGDVATGFIVTFKARGQVVNPQIKNNKTNEIIKIKYTMQKDDVIQVYNLPFNKKILINGEKAFKYLDRLNTRFFDLEVGENSLSFEAEVNTTNLDVLLNYSPKYL